jgi:hypothetical protein
VPKSLGHNISRFKVGDDRSRGEGWGFLFLEEKYPFMKLIEDGVILLCHLWEP